jgi:hypothetical protein
MALSLFLPEQRNTDSARSLPSLPKWLQLVYEFAPYNKPLQRSGLDKVLGRGRGCAVLEQVMRARVLKCQWPAAERGC